MKSFAEIRDRLADLELRVAQLRALGRGSDRQARDLEGQIAALYWVLNEGDYRDAL